MAESTTAEEALARVERLSKELAQLGTARPQPSATAPLKPTGPKVH